MKTLISGRVASAVRFQIKAVNVDVRTFQGLASTWATDLGNDVIHQGAFATTLASWKSSGRVLPLIDQHNYGSIRNVIGKMTEAQETPDGLLATFEVVEGPDGDEPLRRIKGGYIDSLSIGYEPVRWEYERPEGADPRDAIRHLHEVKLYEVSLVIWPMNPDARIDLSTVKSAIAAAEARSVDPAVRAELVQLHAKIGSLIAEPDAVPALVAPDDPRRLAAEAVAWDATLALLR